MEWGVPKNLIWLWLVPALGVVFGLAALRRKILLKRFGDSVMIGRLIESLDSKKRWIKRAAILLAVFLTVLALAQPHFRKKETLVERRGSDVMIVLDVSRSMLAKDIAPSRLEKAKLELAGLIDKLKSDRIGIVVFAGEAMIQCPLTLDKGAVKLFLSTISPNLISYQGTALGRAIQVATEAFDSGEKGPKAMVLLTDGEDHEADPLEAARRAKEEGIRIFTIGIGTPDGSTLPGTGGAPGHKKDRAGEVVISKLNEPLLASLAETTGGHHYRSSRGELETESIARQIRQMGQKTGKNEWSVEYEENYQYFLVPVFILLLFELFLSEGKKT